MAQRAPQTINKTICIQRYTSDEPCSTSKGVLNGTSIAASEARMAEVEGRRGGRRSWIEEF